MVPPLYTGRPRTGTKVRHWETGKTVRLLLIRQSEDLLAAMLPPLRAIRRRIDSIAGNRPRQCLLARFFCKPERGTAAAFHGGGQEQPLPPAPLPYLKFAGKRL